MKSWILGSGFRVFAYKLAGLGFRASGFLSLVHKNRDRVVVVLLHCFGSTPHLNLLTGPETRNALDAAGKDAHTGFADPWGTRV